MAGSRTSVKSATYRPDVRDDGGPPRQGLGVNSPSPVPPWWRQFVGLPLLVQTVIGVLTFFGLAATTSTVVVLSNNHTTTVTAPAVTVTVPAPSANGGTTPKAPLTLGWLSDTSNPSNNNFNEVKSQPVTVDGRTYAHTVELVDPDNHCGTPSEPSYVSFPVPSGATQLAGMFGWGPESNGSADELIVYANSPTGKVLWSYSFSNSGLPLTFKSFNNIAGTHAVIFELVGEQCDSGTFVLAEAQFTS
jgi:hypothetical protein